MMACAVDAGVPFAWVTADEVYGRAPTYDCGWRLETLHT